MKSNGNVAQASTTAMRWGQGEKDIEEGSTAASILKPLTSILPAFA
jgi:hypothetical protein